MSSTFTQKLKQRIINSIRADLKFDTPDKFIDNLQMFAETLMTDDEKFKTNFLRGGCEEFRGHFHSYRVASNILGQYFRYSSKLVIPDRIFELKEFKDHAEGIALKTMEFMKTVKQIEDAVNSCNGFREFEQTLPQFKSYLVKAREELYGTRSKTPNLPAAPIEIENLNKYLEVKE